MRRDLEMTTVINDPEWENLRGVRIDDNYIHIDFWAGEHLAETKTLDWGEWDLLVAEIERFRKLKAQSEAA